MTILLTTHNMREAEFLCGRIAFLRAGEIVTIGTAEGLKKMIRLGDVLRVEFEGTISEEKLLRADGVINFVVTGGLCEVMVDDGEKRLGPLVTMLARAALKLRKLLEADGPGDVFIEFANEVRWE
jgi:ABC-2 type transport system ATP-binding protein